ncbi:uncharacterized protein LOC143357868 [Halictus rubicundus]|uniref:uncharacterized protein LOC143357868 n=1 Tax=Halictus rubicundus TaxID=77578 RepID=UPI004036B641
MGNSDSKQEEKHSKSKAQATIVPTVRTVRTVPTASTVPTVSTVRTVSTVPTVPTVSTVPTVPTVSTVPTVPTVPTGRSNPTVPIVPFVALPQPFLTLDDFFENWHLWKQNFLQYKASKEGSTQTDWENTLLNLMGPIGQEIFTLIKAAYQRGNLESLLRLFDEYSVFAAKRRLPRESIYEYMDDLQTIVRNKGLQHGEDVIRHRILAEINKSEFTSAAKKLIPTFVFSSAYNTLTMKQIAFLWDFYISKKNCRKCGNEHGPNNCPAIGKQCQKCSKFDHYNRRCPHAFTFDCKYCGGMHKFKHCPAYNETCTKCNRLHHFYWKCQAVEVLQCRFCGLTHTADRSTCPAKNTFCIYCNLKGHFSSRCHKRPQPGRI